MRCYFYYLVLDVDIYMLGKLLTNIFHIIIVKIDLNLSQGVVPEFYHTSFEIFYINVIFPTVECTTPQVYLFFSLFCPFRLCFYLTSVLKYFSSVFATSCPSHLKSMKSPEESPMNCFIH